MKTLFAGLCLVFTTLFSCQQKEGQFKSVSVDDFSTLIANPEVQLLDVRTVAEYSEGHVPHSININVLDESFETMADKPVAVYCRSGKRSKKAAAILSKKGYINYIFVRQKPLNSYHHERRRQKQTR